jgi:hypothetical protein
MINRCGMLRKTKGSRCGDYEEYSPPYVSKRNVAPSSGSKCKVKFEASGDQGTRENCSWDDGKDVWSTLLRWAPVPLCTSFIKIGSGMRKLIEGDTRQQGHRISLPLFFPRKS